MKRKRRSPEQEWFHEAGNGLLSSEVLARGLQRLAQKAQAAGAKGAEKLENAGNHGAVGANVNRDMLRTL